MVQVGGSKSPVRAVRQLGRLGANFSLELAMDGLVWSHGAQVALRNRSSVQKGDFSTLGVIDRNQTYVTIQYCAIAMQPESAKNPILHTTDRLECHWQDFVSYNDVPVKVLWEGYPCSGFHSV